MSTPSRRSSSQDSNIDGGSAADERKRKRRLSNRLSARRARERKEQRVQDLIAEASRLQAENARVEAQIRAYNAELGKVDAENAVLRAHHGELAGLLQDISDVLEYFPVDGENLDILEIPDPMLRPCHAPFAPQQLAAAGAMTDAFPF